MHVSIDQHSHVIERHVGAMGAGEETYAAGVARAGGARAGAARGARGAVATEVEC